ncbi:MAG: DUF4097 family beta strand repeat protein [Clostridia bacterium]|nr:DUF4097 family beta strand repeat protein [Clostridia bacterium]
MAGKVKKGFSTYLFILFLMLVAAALVTLLVMIFRPFKEVLGYQYICYSDEVTKDKVTDGSSDDLLDFSSLEEIQINCSYATVSVERPKDCKKYSITFKNFVTGFASADANIKFSYNIYYENGSNDKVLCVDVHEPEASLYFAKNVSVSICLPDKEDANLENVELNIENTSGNISIGCVTASSNKITLASLKLQTTRGRIYLGAGLDGAIDKIFIQTKRGGIDCPINLHAQDYFTLNAKSGTLNFNNLSFGAGNLATINIGNCEFRAGTVIGDINLKMLAGYLDVEDFIGDISANNPAEQLSAATITIGEVWGNLSFPFANSSRINIGKFGGGKFYVKGTSGSVKLGETNAFAWIEMTTGSIDIKACYDFEAKTTSGKINAVIDRSDVMDEINITSKKGRVKLGVPSKLEFILNVYNTDGEMRNAGSVNVEGFDGMFELPLVINNGNKPINITTNSKVEVYKVA